jgi:predicted ATPase/class 3 adenylate cyclase
VSDLPTGIVTFLYTDVEGSTRLVQQLGARYGELLADERAVVRSALQAHGGHEVDTEGDATFAAFPLATEALAAAVEIQRAMAAHDWPDRADVRLRIALHTGSPQRGDEGYVGLDVHRAARICNAGHGGQVLLSLASAELVRDQVAPGVTLLDLGEHRLKDLQRPERLFQLVAPDLPADFPALRTLDRHAHNLPVQPTPLLGRDDELAMVLDVLARDDVRLVTLTGPGGIGKTRLCLQLGAELVERFADGVYFVSLASVLDPAHVSPTIAQTLGLRESGERSSTESLLAYLASRELLLLLDNFEQVVAAATQVADLLTRCPRLKVLVTSREPLRIRGEQEQPVPPLALPQSTRSGGRRAALSAAEASRFPAVTLFVERARAVRPDFVLTDESAAAVVDICRRLDGLPLAIELAAARTRLLAPQELLARLSSRLKLLTSGPRDLPARQQTLRGAIAWSYDLLPPGEQMLFRHLSVFAGGWTLDAAESVCGECSSFDGELLDGLSSLVGKSLIRQDETDAPRETRFSMLHIIREYGWEQLQAVGAYGDATTAGGQMEAEGVRRAHARCYLELAERAAPQLIGPDQGDWLRRLEREQGNVRAALAWAQEHAHRAAETGATLSPSSTREGSSDGSGSAAAPALDPATLGLRLAAALWRFWYTRGDLTQGRAWLEGMLALPQPDAGGDRARALRARALYGAATLASTQNDLDRAVALGEESLAISRELGDRALAANALNTLGLIALHQGNVHRAAVLCGEGLLICRELGDSWMIARALTSLGQTAYVRGDFARAASLFEECLSTTRDLGDASYGAVALLYLGHVAREQGDAVTASARFRESLRRSHALGDRLRVTRALDGLATALAADNLASRPERALVAARLVGAAAALREVQGAALHPMDRPAVEHAVERLRAVLGGPAYDEAVAEGSLLPLQEALMAALATGHTAKSGGHP